MTISISGVVTKPGGAGLPGVTIDLSSGGVAAGSTKTGPKGDFEFTGLAAGDFQLTPSLTGYVFTPTSHTYHGVSVSVSTAQFTGASLAISGKTILAGSKTGLAGAAIVVTGKLTGDKESAQTTSAQAGGYSFSDVQLGQAYTLNASLEGYVPLGLPHTTSPLQRPLSFDIYMTKDRNLPYVYLWVADILKVLGGIGVPTVGIGLSVWLYKKYQAARAANNQPTDESFASEQELSDFESYASEQSVGDATGGLVEEGVLPQAFSNNVVTALEDIPLGELTDLDAEGLCEAYLEGAQEAAADSLVSGLTGAGTPVEVISQLDSVPMDLLSDVVGELESSGDDLKSVVDGLKTFLDQKSALTEPTEIGEGGGIDSSMTPDEIAQEAAEEAASGEGFSVDLDAPEMAAVLESAGVEGSAEGLETVLIVVLDVVAG